MAIFYFISRIVAAETIEGGKLFEEIRYVKINSAQKWQEIFGCLKGDI